MSANRCSFFPFTIPSSLPPVIIHVILSSFPLFSLFLLPFCPSSSSSSLSCVCQISCVFLIIQWIFIIFKLPLLPPPLLLPPPPSSSHSSSVIPSLQPLLLPPSVSPPLSPVLDRNICLFLPPITCSPCIRLLIQHYPEVEVKITAIYPLQRLRQGGRG